jgi:hypothetical protein
MVAGPGRAALIPGAGCFATLDGHDAIAEREDVVGLVD